VSDVTFRTAVREDVPAIVRLLADDHLGSTRERATDPLPAVYYAAFEAIAADPNNEVLVACRGEAVVGTLQLTYTPSLSFQGRWRATVESVRTAAALRGQGIGAAFMQFAIERARARGCHVLQLTTHATRPAAHRFYQRLGFASSHVGMKLEL
jgi:GNAT superfamily N-acetyltransferase